MSLKRSAILRISAIAALIALILVLQLTLDVPGHSAADAYTYDPQQPVPTLGGPIYWGLDPKGPVDQRPVLDRPDVWIAGVPLFFVALFVIYSALILVLVWALRRGV